MQRPGDWICECGKLCFARRTECFCGKPKARGQAQGQVQGQVQGQDQLKPGDWICVCGNHNFAKRQACYVCQAARPEQLPRPGDWICVCGENNFGSRTACRKCGNAKPNANEDQLCKVCFERPKDTILACSHFGLCRPCAESVDKCPFCRIPIDRAKMKKVYQV